MRYASFSLGGLLLLIVGAASAAELQGPVVIGPTPGAKPPMPPAGCPARKSGSQLTPRWREMDSNFRFRASGDTPHRPQGEAASHRSRLPLRRDPPLGRP